MFQVLTKRPSGCVSISMTRTKYASGTRPADRERTSRKSMYTSCGDRAGPGADWCYGLVALPMCGLAVVEITR